MSVIRILSDAGLDEALAELTRELSVTAGAVSPASTELTQRVFGAPLTPIEVVRRIIEDVRERGDAALVEYVRKLQGADLDVAELRVPEPELEAAHRRVDARLLEAVRHSAEQVWAYQERFRQEAPPPYQPREGVTLEMRSRPLRRVGMCIPGGKAPYPSSVVMVAVPARVAGVPEIAMMTPCGPDGAVADAVLATAWELGVREVYRFGGAHGVAALALGTETVPRVDKLAGPGNAFVALAKKELYGHVDIDMIAGPSEILIIADETADPRFCAADLLSQAEHDPAASVLLTPSQELAEAVADEVERQIGRLSREKAARECLRRFGVIGVAAHLAECVRLADAFAPEHLEIMTADPDALLAKLSNYGCAFLGPWSTEPVGDYMAGPSHVLPTGGAARFSSPLSFHDFIKRSSAIHYTREALRDVADDLCRIADAEGFDAHANAARVRLESDA